MTREQFNGTFYIVLIVKPHDGDCEERQEMFSSLKSHGKQLVKVGSNQRWKTVNITVHDTQHGNHYIIATIVPIALFVGFFIVKIILLQSSWSVWMAIFRMDMNGIVLPKSNETWSLPALLENSVQGKLLKV